MTLLKIKLRGIRRKSLYRERGYIDLTKEHTNLIYGVYYLFGVFPVWVKLLFSEIVPLWAVINYCCMGETYWKSKKPGLIDAAVQKRCIKTIKL